MTTKELTPEESREWRRKIEGKNVKAEPLVFARADQGAGPFVLEVTNGQGPEGRTLIIHVFKRGDVHPERAKEIVQHALVDVFGEQAGREAECDYRNISELKKRLGNEMVNESHDSLTVIFGGAVAMTRNRDWVRDNMALALARWYERSLSW